MKYLVYYEILENGLWTSRRKFFDSLIKAIEHYGKITHEYEKYVEGSHKYNVIRKLDLFMLTRLENVDKET